VHASSPSAPDLGFKTLQALIEQDHDVVLAVTIRQASSRIRRSGRRRLSSSRATTDPGASHERVDAETIDLVKRAETRCHRRQQLYTWMPLSCTTSRDGTLNLHDSLLRSSPVLSVLWALISGRPSSV